MEKKHLYCGYCGKRMTERLRGDPINRFDRKTGVPLAQTTVWACPSAMLDEDDDYDDVECHDVGEQL